MRLWVSCCVRVCLNPNCFRLEQNKSASLFAGSCCCDHTGIELRKKAQLAEADAELSRLGNRGARWSRTSQRGGDGGGGCCGDRRASAEVQAPEQKWRGSEEKGAGGNKQQDRQQGGQQGGQQGVEGDQGKEQERGTEQERGEEKNGRELRGGKEGEKMTSSCNRNRSNKNKGEKVLAFQAGLGVKNDDVRSDAMAVCAIQVARLLLARALGGGSSVEGSNCSSSGGGGGADSDNNSDDDDEDDDEDDDGFDVIEHADASETCGGGGGAGGKQHARSFVDAIVTYEVLPHAM